MGLVRRKLLLAVVAAGVVAVWASPASALPPKAFPLPGWWKMPAPAIIHSDPNLLVGWQYGYVYPYRSGDQVPVHWEVPVEYQAVGNQAVVVTCGPNYSGGLQIPPYTEIMRGTGNSGLVAQDSSLCTRHPDFVTTLQPGQKLETWAVFHNVPWLGGEVAIDAGYLGRSPFGNVFFTQFAFTLPPEQP